MNLRQIGKITGGAVIGMGVVGMTAGPAAAHARTVNGPANVGSASISSGHTVGTVCNFNSVHTNRGEYKLSSGDVSTFTNTLLTPNCVAFNLPTTATHLRACDPSGCSAWVAA
jgi:hypothetical protein